MFLRETSFMESGGEDLSSYNPLPPPDTFNNTNQLMTTHQITVDTTVFHRAGHAVDTMDAIIQAPPLPVKIYLDK